MTTVLMANVVSTIAMAGVIWVIQLVHYPLFDRVDRQNFVEFALDHQRRISFVVIPLMLTELVTSAMMLWLTDFQTVNTLCVAGLICVGIAWGVTFAISVPQHEKLSKGFDTKAHRILVKTNWIRTIAWTAHAGIVVAILVQSL